MADGEAAEAHRRAGFEAAAVGAFKNHLQPVGAPDLLRGGRVAADEPHLHGRAGVVSRLHRDIDPAGKRVDAAQLPQAQGGPFDPENAVGAPQVERALLEAEAQADRVGRPALAVVEFHGNDLADADPLGADLVAGLDAKPVLHEHGHILGREDHVVDLGLPHHRGDGEQGQGNPGDGRFDEADMPGGDGNDTGGGDFGLAAHVSLSQIARGSKQMEAIMLKATHRVKK